MKTDLATSIGVAIFGLILAYFICNLFIGEIEPVTIKTVDSSINLNLSEPSPEVFNYKALNPTVEVYVGDCAEYNSYGECVEQNVESESTNETESTNESEESNNSESTVEGTGDE